MIDLFSDASVLQGLFATTELVLFHCWYGICKEGEGVFLSLKRQILIGKQVE